MLVVFDFHGGGVFARLFWEYGNNPVWDRLILYKLRFLDGLGSCVNGVGLRELGSWESRMLGGNMD